MLLYTLSITWTATLFCIALRAVQRVRLGAAVVIGLVSYLAYVGVFGFVNH